MNTRHPSDQDRLLQLRAQLLQRIAAQRGGAVSRVEMAAEHDVRAWDAHAQATTEINEEFAMNEHETAELAAIDIWKRWAFPTPTSAATATRTSFRAACGSG